MSLAVLVPSRARPHWASRLSYAAHKTAADSDNLAVMFGVDRDDPFGRQYAEIGYHHGDSLYFREPAGLAAMTNELAELARRRGYTYVASLGDDHLPRTPGWDQLLTAAIEAMPGGIGISYCANQPDTSPWETPRNLPEMVVMSTAIVGALGWMANPACRHYYIDDTWLRLGRAAECIAYHPGVVIEHLHPSAGKAPQDETYERASADSARDKAAYEAWWLSGDADADAQKIRELIRAGSAA